MFVFIGTLLSVIYKQEYSLIMENEWKTSIWQLIETVSRYTSSI